MYRVTTTVAVLLAALTLASMSSGQDADSADETRTTPTVERTVYDAGALSRPVALSDTELAGRRLFVQRCAICHDPVGQPLNRAPGPQLDQRTVDADREAAARQMIATGLLRMPGFQYALRADQIDQLVSYLKTVPPD